jgi:ribose/xylose/arabinose/galactoside ABC-type transport system permease subunit
VAEIVEKPKPLTAVARERAGRVFRHENAALTGVLIGLIFAMGGVTRGKTLSLANAMNVLLLSSIRGMAAIGQGMVILTAGIDVSVGGNGLFCSILGAALMTSNWQNIIGHPLPLGLTVLIMLLAGTAWGAFNGAMVSRVGIPALISTLGLWQITTGVAYRICQGRDVHFQPEGLGWWGSGRLLGVPVPVVIFVVVAVIAYFVLHHTTYGRFIYAVGGNPVSAWLSGINVKNILFSVYAIAGFLSGLAAFIMLGRMMLSSMSSLGGLEIDTIAAATVGGISLMGGRGTLIGVVLGTLIIGVVNNGLSLLFASPAIVSSVKGSIIILAVTIDYMRRRRR